MVKTKQAASFIQCCQVLIWMHEFDAFSQSVPRVYQIQTKLFVGASSYYFVYIGYWPSHSWCI